MDNPPIRRVNRFYKKQKIRSSCEIEDLIETHICKLCVILRSRVLLGVCPHCVLIKDFSFRLLTLLLSSFWTRRGHRCRPPVLAFNFYRT